MLAWSWPISFDRPEWLWLLAAIPVIAAISVRSLSGLEKPRRIVAVVLRSLVIAALALALARIEFVKRNDHVAVMFVLDRSRSIPDKLREAAQDYVRRLAKRADRDDRVGVVGFDGQANVDVVSGAGGLDLLGQGGFGMAAQPDRTDVAAGVRMAMASFPEGYARRIVLLTDGNENTGNLADEIEAAVANHIGVDAVPLQYRYAGEILFDRISVPTHASRDTKLPLRLVIKSRRTTRAKLALYHNGVEVPLADPVVDLTGGMQPCPITIPMELQGGGVHRFDARLTPLAPGDDSIVENNQATAFTFVGDQGRVLILTPPGSRDDVGLLDALKREKIDVEMFGVDQINIDLLALQEYAVLVLANISADTFNDEQHKALASYVRDFGGGLVMTGGNDSFGAGGWSGTPLEEVSPVSFRIPSRKVLPSAALVLVIDRSGSMSCPVHGGPKTQQAIANESAVLAARTLLPSDIIGVVAFDTQPEWVVKLGRCGDLAGVERKIRTMSPGGGTDMYPALASACEQLSALGSTVNIKHMILLTDGQSQDGPYDALGARLSASGITLSTIGIGDGINNEVLRRLALLGGGNFYPVRDPRLLPKLFFRETRILRSRLIVEKEFQPQQNLLGAPFLAGLQAGALPKLRGYARTFPKSDAVVPIVAEDEDRTDPIFAFWNVEMGKMAVFTSGWWPHWGADWVAWDTFGKFWAQVLRWAMRQEAGADFDVLTRLEGNKGRVVIEALNKDASYLNFLTIGGRLLTPSLDAKRLHLTQTGPGRYEGDFDVTDHGNYLINLQYSSSEQKTGSIRTGLSLSYSPEFRELDTNLGLLSRIVDRAGGRLFGEMNPETDDLFRRDLPPDVSRQPVWRWVVAWLLLPLFLLDVAGRRLASVVAMSVYVEMAVFVVACAALATAQVPWYWLVPLALVLAEVTGWAIRYRHIIPAIRYFTSGAATLARVPQRSTVSLGQLKGVREKVRDGIDSRRTEKKPESIALEPAAHRSRRFDVGDEAAVRPASDLAESLGSAAARAEDLRDRPEPERKGAQARPPGPGDMASRLLKAKKRAQDEIDKREQKD